MPSTTPGGLPYPLPTDPIANGADAIHNLAAAIENTLPFVQSGSVTVTVTAAATGTATVTFPQAFAATPNAVATAGNSNYSVSLSGYTATGMTITVRHLDNTSATVSFVCRWIAVGTRATSASAPASTDSSADASAGTDTTSSDTTEATT